VIDNVLNITADISIYLSCLLFHMEDETNHASCKELVVVLLKAQWLELVKVHRVHWLFSMK